MCSCAKACCACCVAGTYTNVAQVTYSSPGRGLPGTAFGEALFDVERPVDTGAGSSVAIVTDDQSPDSPYEFRGKPLKAAPARAASLAARRGETLPPARPPTRPLADVPPAPSDRALAGSGTRGYTTTQRCPATGVDCNVATISVNGRNDSVSTCVSRQCNALRVTVTSTASPSTGR